jgi:hypothetical protein
MIDARPLLLEDPRSPVDVEGERRRRNRRVRALTAGSALLAMAGIFAPREAAAAGEEDDAVVVHHTERPSIRSMRAPTGPRLELTMHRELDWTRLALSDDMALRVGPLQLDGSVRGMENEQGQIDIREDMWAATPRAMTSVATAATSLLTSGLGVFEVWRGGHMRARHGVKMFWRRRGVMLAWRLEF